MRKILFRGKLSDGKWSFGNLCVDIKGIAIITPDESIIGSYGRVDPESVGQYTGLEDKNGKKIFEGDILYCPYNNSNGVVNYSQGMFVVTFGAYSEEALCTFGDAEIIGNIYDSPEMLKSEDNTNDSKAL